MDNIRVLWERQKGRMLGMGLTRTGENNIRMNFGTIWAVLIYVKLRIVKWLL
jgi:hypothetical protein